jgi:hypothetical protein
MTADHREASMNIDPTLISKRFKGTLPELLGIRFVETSSDRMIAELAITDTLTIQTQMVLA